MIIARLVCVLPYSSLPCILLARLLGIHPSLSSLVFFPCLLPTAPMLAISLAHDASVSLTSALGQSIALCAAGGFEGDVQDSNSDGSDSDDDTLDAWEQREMESDQVGPTAGVRLFLPCCYLCVCFVMWVACWIVVLLLELRLTGSCVHRRRCRRRLRRVMQIAWVRGRQD